MIVSCLPHRCMQGFSAYPTWNKYYVCIYPIIFLSATTLSINNDRPLNASFFTTILLPPFYRVSQKNAMEIQQAVVHHKLN
jgi:hypothetical protein